MTCRKHLGPFDGVFCANCSSRRGAFAPCKQCWCPECCVPLGKKPFLVKREVDENGEELMEPGGETRFLQAGAGDHLVVPFQCELCHFRNAQGRNPAPQSFEDQEMLEHVRRASPDSFWARETTTVKANLQGAKRIAKCTSRLSLPPLTPSMGPFPLRDEMGMGLAIVVLDRSLDSGRTDAFVQFETTRKTRSALTNVWQATSSGLSDVIGSCERTRVWMSEVESHSFWFSQFMTGFHKRVGDARKQDKAIATDVVHDVVGMLEKEWSRLRPSLSTQLREAKRITEMGCWFLIGFCLGLRGEEMPLMELAGTASSLTCLSSPLACFHAVVTGRTKGNQISANKFKVPCVGKTEGTSLCPGRWMRRLGCVKQELGETKGRLFKRQLNPPRLMEFQEDFYLVLERVQATCESIEDSEDVRETYGILRSLRKGNAAHALNMEVSPALINSFNRWR